MTTLLRWLLETSIAVAVLTVFVCLLSRLLRNYPSVRHALWLVVLVKFLTPSVIAWPWPVEGMWTSAGHAAARPTWLLLEPAGLLQENDGVTDAPLPDASAVATAARTPLPPAPHDNQLSAVAAPARTNAAAIVFGLWLLGCVAATAVQARRIARRWRLVRRGQPASRGLAVVVDDVSR